MVAFLNFMEFHSADKRAALRFAAGSGRRFAPDLPSLPGAGTGAVRFGPDGALRRRQRYRPAGGFRAGTPGRILVALAHAERTGRLVPRPGGPGAEEWTEAPDSR